MDELCCLIELLSKNLSQHCFIRSVNIIGSAVYEKTSTNKEVDFYILVDKLTTQKHYLIKQEFLKLQKLYSRLYIEFRRGPFKAEGIKQLHLIIDDMDTVRDTPSITINDWSLNSINIYGKSIQDIITPVGREQLIVSLKSELSKTIAMVARGHINYKEWTFDSKRSTLLSRTRPIGTAHEFKTVMKYAFTAMRNNFFSLAPSKNNHYELLELGEGIKSILQRFASDNNSHFPLLSNCVTQFNRKLLSLSHAQTYDCNS